MSKGRWGNCRHYFGINTDGWGEYGHMTYYICIMFQMPRVYKRKTEKKYTLETLKIAIREIQEKNLSFRKAAEKYITYLELHC